MLTDYIMQSKEIIMSPIVNAITPSGVIGKPFACGDFIFTNMKLIPLSQGKFAMVDDEDYEYLSQFKWNAHKNGKTYYAERYNTVNGKQLYSRMHREVMNTPKGMEVDHRDHNGLNCQKHNLRNCTHKQNMSNQRSRGYSKYRGVMWVAPRKKWTAVILNPRCYIGYYDDEITAAKEYDKVAKERYGEFANLNFK
jgi:hypothetical protein